MFIVVPIVEDDDESSEDRAASPVHAEAGTISGVHPCLHIGQRTASRACRHPAVLPTHAADGSPDAADAREGRIDHAAARSAPLPLRSPRAPRVATARPARFQPVKITVTSYSHVRHFK